VIKMTWGEPAVRASSSTRVNLVDGATSVKGSSRTRGGLFQLRQADDVVVAPGPEGQPSSIQVQQLVSPADVEAVAGQDVEAAIRAAELLADVAGRPEVHDLVAALGRPQHGQVASGVVAQLQVHAPAGASQAADQLGHQPLAGRIVETGDHREAPCRARENVRSPSSMTRRLNCTASTSAVGPRT